ncbi:branched-chain amino acid transport system substrate-binding protein [Variovorax boronicumulans]|uniref:ABC transporter substrate-binding protein n=1 Tax=Variovorax boronicumulans TaxID=436515 RepID=UPI002786DB2D|nr:ABC transporter substrate-binding protein [Variovorax boronicumulans]MDP9994019.1 branched-chain amino acid transport system substrate-binding protein [Variovorax boronicumulans]MDQ0005118.1 branched-chain amino acid transport system substrate-binding protein [Variovorax boronicumulans]
MSTSSRFRVLFGAAALCLSFIGANGVAAQTVKVGMVVGISGPGADIGESMVRGADLYLALHGKDLPSGVKVELIKRDDGSNPDRTKRLAQELVVRDKVQLLTGVTLSPQALTIAPVSTEAKIPTLIMNATTGSLTRNSPYFVRFSYANWQMAYTMGAWAAKHDIKSAYTLVADYAAGHDMEAGFKRGFEDNGGSIIGSDRTPMGTTDYLPAMARIKSAAPKSLFVFTLSGAPSIATMKAFRDSGLQAAGVQLLSTAQNVSDQQLPQTGPASLGMINSAVYIATDPRPSSKQFLTAFKAAYGQNAFPDLPAVAAWNSMEAVFGIIKKHGPNFTSDQAMDVLKNWKSPNTPAGPIAIDPVTRDIVHEVSLAKIQKVGEQYENVAFDVVKDVKDPWKAVNPEK